MASQALQYLSDIEPPDDSKPNKYDEYVKPHDTDGLQKEGYYQGPRESKPAMHLNVPASPRRYDSDTAAALVAQYESGGKNIPNYRYDVGHTASGIYQITDTNWQKYAPRAGIDIKQFPTAMSDTSGKLQRAVFDIMYTEQGFKPWSNFNPRLADAIGEGRLATPGWTPSPAAFDAEDKKSNTSLRYMDPLQFLSLLPPLENDEATKAKRENLNQSLSKGDNVEALPSLEVETKGNDLKIVDSDGRNRAQAAIDAGVDKIPVAINGAQEDKEYKNLVGKKKLPYTEFKRVPPATVPEDVARFAPGTASGVNPGQLQEQSRAQARPQGTPPGPALSTFDPALAAATAQSPVPTKPDFYPGIVAGVNSDIYNPRGIGYRGVGVPDEATNATAGGRIAAANNNSLGQVGLAPSSPASSLNLLLSNLNPISSAQAGELSALQTPNNIPPPPDTGGALQYRSDIPPPPERAPRPPLIPGLDPYAIPLANALMSPAVNLAGDVSGLVGGQPRWAGGALPTWEGFEQAREDAARRNSIPENPGEQALSTILSSPFMALGWAAKKILEAGFPEGSKIPTYIERGAGIGLDLLAPLALHPAARNALAARIAPAIGRVAQTPEMKATRAINKAQPGELRRGGMPVADIANRLASAQASGIPLAPADFMTRGGPMGQLFGHAVEHSPEATADATRILEERTEGIPPSSSSRPVGGTLERMTKQVENHFSRGSAHDAQATIDKSLSDNQKKLNAANSALKNHVNVTPADVRREARLKVQKAQAEAQIARDKVNSNALDFGRDILKRSTTPEEIRDYLNKRPRTISNEELDHFKMGISEAIRRAYGGVSKLGREPYKVAIPDNVRANIAAAFNYDTKAADSFMDTVRAEEQVSSHTDALLREINNEGYISQRNWFTLHRLAEALGHVGLAVLHGIPGISHLGYWALRGGRLLADYLSAAGGPARRSVREETVNALLNPNAKIATSGNGLLAMPARSATSQARINSLSNALVPAGVMSAASANQGASP